MAGTNPAIGHKYRITVTGVQLTPIKVQTSALASPRKVVELSDLSKLVTDVQESVDFTLLYDSDDRVGLAYMDAWMKTRDRRNGTLQALDNPGTSPVLIFQLQAMSVSNGKPVGDMDVKAPETLYYEYTCHAKVVRLPS